jgi:general secretion pathway protein M
MKALCRVDLHALLARLLRLQRWRGIDVQAVSRLVARLSPRERLYVNAAGLVLGGTLVYLLLIDPVWEAYTHLQARVVAKERELGEVRALRRAYQALRAQADRTRLTPDTSFSPLAFLEDLATNTVGREKVTAINPTGRTIPGDADQATIELQLSGVALRELVELLYKIDAAHGVLHTVHLSIKKRYKDPSTFDVALTTVTFSPR